MKMRFTIPAILSAAGLLFFTACSDTSSATQPPPAPPPATPTLTYSNPATSGVFSFVRNTALSSANLVVLDLVADGQHTSASGLSFIVTLNNTDIVEWAKVSPADTMHVRNGEVFDIGAAPESMVAKLEGNQLKVTVGQKGIGVPQVDLNDGPLARVALVLKSGAPQGNVSFTVNKFQIIPGTRTTQNIDTSRVVFGALSYST